MNFEQQTIDSDVKLQSHTGAKIVHPDASGVYNRGILGMIFCLMPTIIGLVFVNQCLDMARDARRDFAANPDRYLESTIHKVHMGRTYGYIGLGFFIGEIVLLIGFMTVAT